MVEIRSYSIDELEELTGFNQRTISYYIQQGLLPKVGRRGRSTRYPQLFVDRLRFIQRVRELQDSGLLGSVTLPRIARVIWYLIEQSGDTSEFPELDDREIQRFFEDERIPDERVLGESRDGDPVTASFGKFGPYVRAGEATASIEAQEFNSITLEDALARVNEKPAEKKASTRRDKLAARMEGRVEESGPALYAADVSEPSMMLDELVAYSRESSKPPGRPELDALADLAMPRAPEPDRLVQEIEHQVRRGRRRGAGRTETWTRSPITDNIEISVQGIDPEQADLVDSLARRIRKLLGLTRK